MFIKEGNTYYNINLSTIQCITEEDRYFSIKITEGEELSFQLCDLKKFLEFLKESKKDSIIDKKMLKEIIRNEE
jgi:hypothetical protein